MVFPSVEEFPIKMGFKSAPLRKKQAKHYKVISSQVKVYKLYDRHVLLNREIPPTSSHPPSAAGPQIV